MLGHYLNYTRTVNDLKYIIAIALDYIPILVLLVKYM